MTEHKSETIAANEAKKAWGRTLLADIALGTGAIALAALTLTYLSPNGPDVSQSADTLTIQNIEFTAKEPVSIAAAQDDYRASLLDLASTVPNRTSLLGDADAYFGMLQNAGLDYLRGRAFDTQSSIASLHDRISSGKGSDFDRTLLQFEQTRLDYYTMLIANREGNLTF